MIATPRSRALERLHLLEWRHDGPIPAGCLPAAPFGDPLRADGALIDRLAQDGRRAVAEARRQGAPGGLDRGSPAIRQLAASRSAGLALRPAP